MTTSAYAPLTADQQIFKTLIWGPMLTLGENWLEMQIPALNFPGIKQFDEAMIRILTDWAFSQLCLLIDVTAIKLVNAAHQGAYEQASLRLKVILAEKGISSDEYKKALADDARALSQFTRFGH